MFPPLLLKPTDTVYSMCACQKSPKRSAKGSDSKEDDRACPSRSYYSQVLTHGSLLEECLIVGSTLVRPANGNFPNQVQTSCQLALSRNERLSL